MNRDSFLLLTLGLLVGFIVTYLIVRDRDLGPIVVRESATAANTVSGEDFEREMAMIRELEAALVERPEDFQLLVDLANLHFDTRNFQNAIVYYERALQANPDDASLRTDMGTALYYSDRVDEAIAEFQRALTLEPNHPQTLFNMGVVLLEQRDDREGAIELWEQLIRANPNYPQRAMVQSQIDLLRNQP